MLRHYLNILYRLLCPVLLAEETRSISCDENLLPSSKWKELRKNGSVRYRNLLGVAAVISLALSASACGDLKTGNAEVYGIARFKMPAFPETGANKIQIFTEMHYQPSYRMQEGPRLAPPPDSVPVNGKELRYLSLEDHKALQISDQATKTYDATTAQKLYELNCMVCHGPTLKGPNEPDKAKKAKILSFMTRAPLPEDLTSKITKNSTDGELFAFISNGGRQGYALRERGKESTSPMPEFRFLLTEDERWALVTYLRSVQETH